MDTEIGVVAPENEGLQYLTVTYHSEGHTSGEVPVDGNRYVVPRISNTIPPYAIVFPEQAIVMGPGTLYKEGAEFRGWTPRTGFQGAGGFQPGHEFGVFYNIDFDAEWWPLD